ncbi:galactosylceramide sulfotransferase-like [Penaeus monodon]|uniref:galactosylceramide sulfotransferase-like n=1 Tax=Penaeus monodon TaxID=6687 RepID=UPI0018A730C3|nr:galactosylceramide sulfotransferase-like [Penaeus monodon]
MLCRSASSVQLLALPQAGMIPEELLPPGGKVDLFAVHSRLNVEEHRRVVHRDARWVTIVREPTSVFESLYSFYGIARWYSLDVTELKKVPLEVREPAPFLCVGLFSRGCDSFPLLGKRSATRFGSDVSNVCLTPQKLKAFPRFGDIFGKNQMLFDLGFPDDLSEARLRQAIQETDRLFDLVMVAERMDESLVLLRHLLCWSLHDVVVFAKNARREGVRPALDAHTRRTLRELNGADGRLYEHFLAKHQRAVLDFGVRRMAREVAALRSLRERYFEACGVLRVEGHNPFPKFREYSGLVGAYATDSDDEQCQRLSFSEIALLDEARDRQVAFLEKARLSQQKSGSDV